MTNEPHIALPEYWLPRPDMQLGAEVHRKLEAIYQAAVGQGGPAWIDPQLPVPVWQFLCWLTDVKGHLLHGTGDPGIALFEPRQSNDVGEFGNRKAVYAASDGIWPMFFAVSDRSRYPMTISNAAIRVEMPEGLSRPHYFFSMSDVVLAQKPWREGVVYVLPRAGFEQESPYRWQGMPVLTNHWASPEAVQPLAKLRVRPEDFPFLARVRAHNDEVLGRRVAAKPNGFPWIED